MGDFRVLREGVAITSWNRPSAKRLLKMLALAPNHHLAVEVVIEAFWPGSEQPRARQRLHHQVYLLNQVLSVGGQGQGAVRAVSLSESSIRLSERLSLWVDTVAFERALDACAPASADTDSLEKALALYHGRLLPEDGDDALFTTQRNYLEQRWINGLYALAGRHLQSQNQLAATVALQRILQAAPAEERAHRLLMEVYGRTGQLSQVEHQFAACKLALMREFAAPPSELTVRVYRSAMTRILDTSPHEPQQESGGAVSIAKEAVAAVCFTAPVPLVQLIGRESLVAQCCRLVLGSGWRLHTLFGPGGVGKTQLALRLAHELAPHFRHGVCFVALAEVDTDGVLERVARALGIVERPKKNLQELLLEFLADKHLLLVLDNFEHVLASATLITPLLQRCPLVSLLVTSRARLNLVAESVLEVPPLLDDPQSAGASTPDLHGAAVQLFAKRARAADPRFALDSGNAPDVIAIADRLGGLPLALELAAARVPLYGVQNLRRALEQGLDAVVAGGGVDRPQRHRSLDASMAWSYALLAGGAQKILHRLALFVEPFSLVTAQAVCADMGEAVTDSIQTLLEAGFVARSADTNATQEPVGRFTLLTLTQEFLARRPLSAQQALADARAFIAHHQLEAERLDALFDTGEASNAVTRFSASHMSFYAALEHAQRIGDYAALCRTVRSLVRYWGRAGSFTRSLPWVQCARQHLQALPEPERGWLLLSIGYYLIDHADPTEAHVCAGQAIAHAQRHSDQRLDARASLLYAGTAVALGIPDAGVAALQRTQAYAVAASDSDLLHKASINLGSCYLQTGNVSAARAQWQACNDRFDNQRVQARVSAVSNLALASHYCGQHDAAQRLYELALDLENSGRPQNSRLLHILLRQSWVFSCCGNAQGARDALDRARDTARRASMSNWQEMLSFQLGKIEYCQEQHAAAAEHLSGAAHVREGRADPWDLLDSRIWLFWALFARHSHDASAGALLPLLLSTSGGWRQELPRVLEATGAWLVSTEQLHAAALAWQSAQTQRTVNGIARFPVEQEAADHTFAQLNQRLPADWQVTAQQELAERDADAFLTELVQRVSS